MKAGMTGLLAVCERLAAKAPDFEPGPRRVETAEERAAGQWSSALTAAPPRYRSIPITTGLVPEVADWRGEPTFATFIGKVGTGKTWQATALWARLRIDTGWSAAWYDAAEAVERIRTEIAGDDDGRTLRRLTGVHLLLLDDLLAERDTEFARDKLSYVLRHRHAHLLPTILTSNSTNQDGEPNLRAITKVDPRLGSRIAEGLVIALTGEDMRLNHA